ncbi:hypothetical protein HYU07_02865 [Candidatus Woesearchaeota archaeon]|nr:hypothetical protein [Candidatus Woesearchaeota archaeon]
MFNKFNIRRFGTFFLVLLLVVFLYCYIYLQIGYPKAVAIEEYDKTNPIINEKTEILDYRIFNYPIQYIRIYFTHATKEGLPPKVKSVYIETSQEKSEIFFLNSIRLIQKGWDDEFLKVMYPSDYEVKSRERYERSNRFIQQFMNKGDKMCLYEFDNYLVFNKTINLRCYSLQDKNMLNSITKEQKKFLYSSFPTDNLTEIYNYITPEFRDNLLSDIGDFTPIATTFYMHYSITDYADLKLKPEDRMTYTVYKMPLQKNWTVYTLFSDSKIPVQGKNFYFFNLSTPLDESKINADLRPEINNWFVENNYAPVMDKRRYDFVKIKDKNCYPLIDAENERIENIYCITDKNNTVETTLFIVSCKKFMFCDRLNNDELKKSYYSFIEQY